MSVKLHVVGNCDWLGDIVEPFDHVLLRYRSEVATHDIVIPVTMAANVAQQILSAILPKAP